MESRVQVLARENLSFIFQELRQKGPEMIQQAARQLKPLDFVALCEKSGVRARVDVWGVAKSWQAQGIRGYVDVSLERTFGGTQWHADAAGAVYGGA